MKLPPLRTLFVDLDGIVFNEDTGEFKEFDQRINTSCRHFLKNGYLIFGISHIYDYTKVNDELSLESCYAEMHSIMQGYSFFKKILYIIDSNYDQILQFTMNMGSVAKISNFVDDLSKYSALENLELAAYIRVIAYLNSTYSINFEDSFFISNNESLLSITDKFNIPFLIGRTWLSLYAK